MVTTRTRRKVKAVVEDSPTISQARQEFRRLQQNAAASIGVAAWRVEVDKLVKAIAKKSVPTPEQWLEAAQKATVPCDRCNGTGQYAWGGSINGKPVHTGQCFRCTGKGRQDQEDFCRNMVYDRHAISRAFNGY